MTLRIDMPQRIEGNFVKPDGSNDSFEADSWVEQAGFAFSETRSGDADFVRTLSDNGKTILTARKSGREIHLENVLRRYSYHITLGEEN